MADNIQFENIVGQKMLDNGGYFGDLMSVLGAHIGDAIDNQRITQAEAGQIYTGVIPGMIQQAVQFELGHELGEEQIRKAVAETKLTNRKVL